MTQTSNNGGEKKEKVPVEILSEIHDNAEVAYPFDLSDEEDDNDEANQYDAGLTEGLQTGYKRGAKDYWIKCYLEYTALQEQAQKLADVLEQIKNWQLPGTGKFWDKEQTQPMSYEGAYGSNGSRDYFKEKAEIALLNYNNYLKSGK